MAPAIAEEMDLTTDERFARRPIADFVESALNPRTTFDEAALRELAASITEKDVIEPLVARPLKNHPAQLEIICGARRFRASKLADKVDLPVIIRAYTDAQAMEIMAIENGQRASVPPLEEAEGYKRLLLIEKSYTAAMIAKKIGHDERYVWNRLRLLELIPEAQQVLRAGIIGVEHAEVLAKLKESDQKRAISRQNGGLFASDTALEFEDRPRLGSAAYDRVKPVSVRELKQWVAEHVRLDIEFAAKAAPLDFGESAQRVAAAEQADVRGKTPIPIVLSHMCPYNAADPKGERTYGATSWKKAENKDQQPTCEYARLGVVVAGEGYGQTFHVCINRDKCLVHWKDSVKAKEKANELRAKGETKTAAKVEKKAEKKAEQSWERENRERKARAATWALIGTLVIAEAVDQVKSVKALSPSLAKALENHNGELGFMEIRQHLGAAWFKCLPAALLISAVTDFHHDAYGKESGFSQFVTRIAKPFNLDIKRFEAIRDKHAPMAEAPAPAKKAAKK